MIDATYAPELLPPRQRLDEIVIRLRELLAERSDMGAYGLMLAYIGRQIEDRAMIQEGLSAMAQADAGNPLLPLLRSIWLGAAEGAGPSATTPPAAATPVEPVQPDPNK